MQFSSTGMRAFINPVIFDNDQIETQINYNSAHSIQDAVEIVLMCKRCKAFHKTRTPHNIRGRNLMNHI